MFGEKISKESGSDIPDVWVPCWTWGKTSFYHSHKLTQFVPEEKFLHCGRNIYVELVEIKKARHPYTSRDALAGPGKAITCGYRFAIHQNNRFIVGCQEFLDIIR